MTPLALMLALAVGQAAPVEPPVEPAPPDFVSAAQADDQALLERLIHALDPDLATARQGGIAALEELRDPRSIRPLAYLARDQNGPVALAAVNAIGAFQLPEAERALTEIAIRKWMAAATRAQAIAQLPKQRTATAGKTLLAIASDTGEADPLRRAALDELRRSYLALVAGSEPVAEEIPPANVFTPTLGGIGLGAFTLLSVGTLGQSSAGPAIGFFGGAAIGGFTGYLYRTLPLERSSLYVTAMAWGAWTGMGTALSLSRHPDERLVLGLGVVGEGAAFLAAYEAGEAMGLSPSDVWIANLGGLAGTSAAVGTLLLLPASDDTRPFFAVTLGSGLLGLGLAARLAPSTHFSNGDAALVTIGAFEGAWDGAWLPVVFRGDNVSGSQMAGGLFLGNAAGQVFAAAVAQQTDFTPGDVGHMWLVSSYAKLLGAGVPLMANASGRVIAGSQLALGAAGLVGAALLSDRMSYSSGDATLVTVATALGAWHGIALGLFLDDRQVLHEQENLGVVLTSIGAFGLASLAVAQATDPSAWEVSMGASGAFWGAWFSIWSAYVGGMRAVDGTLLTLIGSDFGTGLTAFLVSPAVRLSPRVLAFASLGGIAGASIFSLVTALVTADGNSIAIANLAGSGVGLVGGGLAAHFLFKGGGDDAMRSEPRPDGSGRFRFPELAIVPQPLLGPGGRPDGGVLTVAVLMPGL
jgi:hypothetical protein